MITGIKLKDMRNAEYLQFMKDILSLTEANNPTALLLTPHYEALQSKLTGLESLFKVSQSNKLTDEILNLDIRRDQAISGMRQVIGGYANHYVPETASAAILLQDNLKLYGNDIEKTNYQAETATLNGIISDWEDKPELAAAVLLLGLQDWKNEMKAANVLFNEKYLSRTQQYGAATEESITSEKTQTNDLYYSLRDNIIARNTIGSTPGYVKIIGEFNALIEQYNTLINNRESKKNNESPSV